MRLETILKNVVKLTGITEKELISKKTLFYSNARRLYAKLAVESPEDYSYATIGKLINKDHSSIMYYVNSEFTIQTEVFEFYLNILITKIKNDNRLIDKHIEMLEIMLNELKHRKDVKLSNRSRI